MRRTQVMPATAGGGAYGGGGRVRGRRAAPPVPAAQPKQSQHQQHHHQQGPGGPSPVDRWLWVGGPVVFLLGLVGGRHLFVIGLLLTIAQAINWFGFHDRVASPVAKFALVGVMCAATLVLVQPQWGERAVAFALERFGGAGQQPPAPAPQQPAAEPAPPAEPTADR